ARVVLVMHTSDLSLQGAGAPTVSDVPVMGFQGSRGRRVARQLVRREEGWFGVLVAVGILIAIGGSGFWTEFADTMVYYAILTMGLNFVLGVTGELDFGHAAFFAVGAYAAAKMMTAHPGADFLLVIVVAAGTAGAASLLMGFPVFRLRGTFVALITVALAEIVAVLVTNVQWIGAPEGISPIPSAHVLGITLQSYPALLWFGLILFVIVAAVSLALSRARFGRALRAIREDELAARSSGIRPLRYRIAAFVIAGVFAGIAGAYFAGLFGFVGPASFNITASFVLGEAVIVGGMGSFLGSVLGAGVLVGIDYLLVDYVPQIAGHEDLVLGALVVAVILFRPQGILGQPFVRKRA
ncbi:MAG: branched-chain amino acid ABC transporter permease, partial [Nitrososphaerales archaeon]